MSQFKPSQTLLPQLEHLLAASTQNMQFPFPPLQSQSQHRPSNSPQDFLNLTKTVDPRNSQSFDHLADPTKRLRHTQQSFTETPVQLRENPLLSQTPEKAKLPKTFANPPIDQSLNNDLIEEFKSKYLSQQIGSSNLAFEEGLTIPSLNNFGQYQAQKLPYQAYLRLLQQQEAEYNYQQQVLMQLEKQQRQYEMLAQRQIAMNKIDPKIVQLYQMAQQQRFDSNKDMPMNPKSLQMMRGPKQNLQANTFEGLEEVKKFMLTDPEKSLNFKQTLFEEPNTSSTADVVCTKREGSEEEESFQYVKVENSNDAVLNKQKIEKPKSENKLFEKEGNDNFKQEEALGKVTIGNFGDNTKTAQKTRKPRQPKPAKPVEIPQYLQDDSSVDFQNLMFITLTNDPCYSENSKSNKFVTINKRPFVLCGQGHDTKVGNRYQASVSEYTGPAPGKRRNPKAIWRADIVKESDLELYFDDLCKIFSCDNINQEHALRLLKRKKYRREKVAVNIGKSKKFYAKVLVVPTEGCEDGINENENKD